MSSLACHSIMEILCKTKGMERYTYTEHNSINLPQNLHMLPGDKLSSKQHNVSKQELPSEAHLLKSLSLFHLYTKTVTGVLT